MAEYVFTCEAPIDRIPVEIAHLVAFPSVLQYGNCQVLSNSRVIITPGEEFVINCSEFSKFGCALIYFKNLDVNEDLNKTVEFNQNNITVEVKNKERQFVLNTKNYTYTFHQSVSLLAKAFYELALVPFCYTPLLTNDLYKVLENITIDNLNDLKEDQLIKTFPTIPNLHSDYYHLKRLVFRHVNLFKTLKTIELMNPRTVRT